MGVKIGKNCNIQSEVMIDYSHYWHISIGNNVTIAPRAHIIAHDASIKSHLNYSKIEKVIIGDNVFIGAGAIILPGVTIGENSIIGAGSVVTKNVPKNIVFAGNPAKTICSLDDYLSKERKKMTNAETFDKSYTINNNITRKMMNEMNDKIGDNYGFVE
jgi:maltose O-acetyltransferase